MKLSIKGYALKSFIRYFEWGDAYDLNSIDYLILYYKQSL